MERESRSGSGVLDLDRIIQGCSVEEGEPPATADFDFLLRPLILPVGLVLVLVLVLVGDLVADAIVEDSPAIADVPHGFLCVLSLWRVRARGGSTTPVAVEEADRASRAAPPTPTFGTVHLHFDSWWRQVLKFITHLNVRM